MTTHIAPPNLAPGSTVLIFGQPHSVEGFTNTGRSFRRLDVPDAGIIEYSFGRQYELIRQHQLTLDVSYSAVPESVRLNLKRDLSGFTDQQRIEATARYFYCRAIHDLPFARRDKTVYVEPALAKVRETEVGAWIPAPSFRTARVWYNRWVACGLDIRGLISNTAKRGRRDARYEPWVYEEIDRAIDEVHANRTMGSISQTLIRARQLIRLRADAEGRVLPGLSKQLVGRGVIEDRIASLGHYELLAKQFDPKEAQRQLRMIAAGPDGQYPLKEVEVDHTVVDMMLRYGDVVLGRPFITALIDRYSRMILGFAITFVPPSWVSVMEALRQAVMPKDELLRAIFQATGVPFEFDWPCWGAPDAFYVDQGSEFLSASMLAAESSLNMRLVQLPKARGDLKGKIESWFHSQNKKVSHRIDGTTFSNPKKRKNYDPGAFAILDLEKFREIFTRYVVDVHNVQRHSGTGEVPLKAWQRGIQEVGPKPAPPPELLSPLLGMVVRRKLLQSGVSYKKLRFNSHAFQTLRGKLQRGIVVDVRIDPLDLTKAYVLDPETLAWVEGHCVSEEAASKLTLSQYNYVQKINSDQRVVDDDYELKLARGEQNLRDIAHEAFRRRGVPPKPVVALVTQGSRPSDHIHGNRTNIEESQGRMGSHDVDQPVLSPPPDPVGPYREKVLLPLNPYPPRGPDGEFVGSWRQPAASPLPPTPANATEQVDRPKTFTGRRRE